MSEPVFCADCGDEIVATVETASGWLHVDDDETRGDHDAVPVPSTRHRWDGFGPDVTCLRCGLAGVEAPYACPGTPARAAFVNEVRATAWARELERLARARRIVIVESAGRRETGARVELPAPALIVNGRLVRPGDDVERYCSELEACEREHDRRQS